MQPRPLLCLARGKAEQVSPPRHPGNRRSVLLAESTPSFDKLTNPPLGAAGVLARPVVAAVVHEAVVQLVHA